MNQSTSGDLNDEEQEESDEDELTHGRRKRKVAFMPSLGESSAYEPVYYIDYYTSRQATNFA